MKKLFLIIIISLMIFLIISLILFGIGKSRDFQFFGMIINKFHTADKVAALTFDDGPNKIFTDRILHILSNENVKATFYLVGAAMENDIITAKKIIEKGHDIGNHTFFHKRLVFKSWDYVKNEIENTDKLIRQTGYNREITFRPPNCKKLFILPYYLGYTKRKTITWNLEPDSIGSINHDSNKMVKYVVENIVPGSIILMHVELAGREASIDALPQIILGLKKEGYEFLTITQLLDHYHKK